MNILSCKLVQAAKLLMCSEIVRFESQRGEQVFWLKILVPSIKSCRYMPEQYVTVGQDTGFLSTVSNLLIRSILSFHATVRGHSCKTWKGYSTVYILVTEHVIKQTTRKKKQSCKNTPQRFTGMIEGKHTLFKHITNRYKLPYIYPLRNGYVLVKLWHVPITQDLLQGALHIKRKTSDSYTYTK